MPLVAASIILLAKAALGLRAAVPTAGRPEGCARLPPLVEEFQSLEEIYSRRSSELHYNGRNYPQPLSPESIWNASHHGYEVNKYPLHRALHKFLSGGGLRLTTVGGSYTDTGPACTVPWPHRLAVHLTQLQKQVLPGTKTPVEIHNKGMGGTVTSAAVSSFKTWAPDLSRTDLLISEYNINDIQLFDNGNAYGRGQGTGIDLMNKMLVYELDKLKTKPGFVYFDLPNRGLKWRSTRTGRAQEAWEGSHFNVAKTLALPLVWFNEAVRNATETHLSDTTSGYLQPNASANRKTLRWHPMCFPGQDTMAYTMYGMLLQEMHEVCSEGLPPERPLAANLEDAGELSELASCAMNPTFDAHAQNGPTVFPLADDTLWEFKEDVQYKPGWIAPAGQPADIVFSFKVRRGIVQITYLQTYENIGSVHCVLEEERKDSPEPVVVGEVEINGLWQRRVSSSNEARIKAKVRPGLHSLRCRSDGRKFKIVSVVAC